MFCDAMYEYSCGSRRETNSWRWPLPDRLHDGLSVFYFFVGFIRAVFGSVFDSVKSSMKNE